MRPWILAASLLFVAACDKPSADECRQAFTNINKVNGVPPSPTVETEAAAFVRQCRAEYSAKDVRCVNAATTKAALDACTAQKK